MITLKGDYGVDLSEENRLACFPCLFALIRFSASFRTTEMCRYPASCGPENGANGTTALLLLNSIFTGSCIPRTEFAGPNLPSVSQFRVLTSH